MMNVLFIRDLIYRLKQDYGQPMDLYVPTESNTDYATGKQIVSRRRFRVARVILLTQVLQRRFVHDVPFLTAGRQWAFGGLFDEGTRTVILAGTDVPKNILINDSCYFNYDNIRYDVVKCEKIEHNAAYVITMKSLNERPADNEVCLRVNSCLQWQEGVLWST